MVAISAGRAIGYKGDLPWPRLKADMKLFREHTEGKAGLMGRKTWESIPAKFRPLPNRHNIVLRRTTLGNLSNGVSYVGSLEEGLQAADKLGHSEVVIIGGSEVYGQSLPLVQRLYLTELEGVFPADCYFPELDLNEWVTVKEEVYPLSESNPVGFTFRVYDRLDLFASQANTRPA
jgi:dihydrofolate reductase